MSTEKSNFFIRYVFIASVISSHIFIAYILFIAYGFGYRHISTSSNHGISQPKLQRMRGPHRGPLCTLIRAPNRTVASAMSTRVTKPCTCFHRTFDRFSSQPTRFKRSFMAQRAASWTVHNIREWSGGHSVCVIKTCFHRICDARKVWIFLPLRNKKGNYWAGSRKFS